MDKFGASSKPKGNSKKRTTKPPTGQSPSHNTPIMLHLCSRMLPQAGNVSPIWAPAASWSIFLPPEAVSTCRHSEEGKGHQRCFHDQLMCRACCTPGAKCNLLTPGLSKSRWGPVNCGRIRTVPFHNPSRGGFMRNHSDSVPEALTQGVHKCASSKLVIVLKEYPDQVAV